MAEPKILNLSEMDDNSCAKMLRRLMDAEDSLKFDLAQVQKQKNALCEYFRDYLEANKKQSINYEGLGTVYKAKHIKGKMEDEAAFIAWLKVNGMNEYIKESVPQKNATEIAEEFAKEKKPYPPGLYLESTITAQMRRS